MPIRKNYTTEALIDSEMEFYRELEDGSKTRSATSVEIHGYKVKECSPAEVEKNGPETKYGIVTNSFANVRTEPSCETNNVIEVLRKGDKVVIHGTDGEFYKISTSVNKNVYISSEYVKED